MRAYALMLLVFIFTASLSFVTNLDIVDGGVSEVGIGGETTEDYVNARVIEMGTLSGTGVEDPTTPDPDFSWYNAFYKMIVVGIPMVVEIFFDSTFGLPFMLMAVGVPTAMAGFISIIAWVIYVVGIAQWMMGKSFKEVE